MIKRDYLERMLQEIADVAARALGLAREDRPEDARRTIDDAYRTVGVPALVLDKLDASSIRMMSGDKLEGLVALLEADAQVADARGDTAHAARRRRLATALRA